MKIKNKRVLLQTKLFASPSSNFTNDMYDTIIFYRVYDVSRCRHII